jgi:DNA-binding response OmpR family regulator
MPKQRVLIVDDEPRYVRLIAVNLEASGYETLAARDGKSALDLAAGQKPDLVLLDIGLPVMDGFEVCRRIREFSASPIIMLTAKAGEADKVRGLDAGADDYLTKPFGPAELLARIRAVLRRVQLPEGQRIAPTFTAGGLSIDFAQHRVRIDGTEVALSPTEYKLLAELAKHAGRIVPTETLLHRIWGPEYGEETQHVRLYVSRLRQKIEADPEHPRWVTTRPGVGYMLQVPEAGSEEQRGSSDSA